MRSAKRPVPDDFRRAVFEGLGYHRLKKRFQAGGSTISRWLKECDLKTRNDPIQPMTVKQSRRVRKRRASNRKAYEFLASMSPAERKAYLDEIEQALRTLSSAEQG